MKRKILKLTLAMNASNISSNSNDSDSNISSSN